MPPKGKRKIRYTTPDNKQEFANTSPSYPPIQNELDRLPVGEGQGTFITPRRGLTNGGTENQTDLRPEIGHATESEIVECDPEDFQSHYLPFVPKEGDINSCLKDMVEAGMLEKGFDKRSAEDKRSQWTADFWPMQPSKNTRNESEAFDGQMKRFRASRNNKLWSMIGSANHKVDAIFTASLTGNIHVTDIAFPFEFKTNRRWNDVRDNRLKVTGACVHILNEDVRRMFIYGVTIEDHRMTTWYFSRTHSAKSQSFNYLEHPGLMVAVLLSLVHATDQELGYDPLIHLHEGPEAQTFVYEFPAKEEEGEQSTTWFKVVKSIFEIRQLSPTGRTTRVWKVIEVEGKDDIQPKPKARERVLKDVWLPANARTEGELQEALFKDIEEFAKGEWRANERLAAFSDDDKNEFAPLLKDERYKELFLCVKREHAGEPCRPRCSRAWKPDVVYLPSFDDKREGQAYGTVPRMSVTTGPAAPTVTDLPQVNTKDITHDKLEAPVEAAEGKPAPTLSLKRNPCREFSPKRRCFFIYDDICTPIDELSNLGECFKVLGGCVLALRLMYCAGWVHRDISTGNVLAFRSDPEGAWTAKLSDLEYAKKFPPGPGSLDPKTGTAYFMPLEISTQRTIRNLVEQFRMVQQPQQFRWKDLFQRPSKMDDRSPSQNLHLNPIQHNFQHDLESAWWILMYLISCLTNHHDPRLLFAPVFTKNPTATIERQDMLLRSLKPHYPSFKPDLRPWLPAVEALRLLLIQEYVSRSDAHDLSSYSKIHSLMAGFFNQLNQPDVAKESDKIKLHKGPLHRANPLTPGPTVGEPERVALDKDKTSKRERNLPKLKRTRPVADVGGPDEDLSLPRRNPMRSARGKVANSDDGGGGASTSGMGLKRTRKNP